MSNIFRKLITNIKKVCACLTEKPQTVRCRIALQKIVLSDLQQDKLDNLVKPAISGSKYFNDTYCGWQSEYTFLERFHAWAQYLITYFKGFQGGLVFTNRKKIEPENWTTYQETNGQWRPGYAITHPFMSIESARAKRGNGNSSIIDINRKKEMGSLVKEGLKMN